MKVIARLADLERYGIVPLSAEADNLSYRILCDLTYQGYCLLCECYGLSAAIPDREQYRTHTCQCGRQWTTPIALDSTPTPNLSGEPTPWCPGCNERAQLSSTPRTRIVRDWTPPGFDAKWNADSKSGQHIASIMLAPEAIHQIAPIAFLQRDRCHTALYTEYGWYGIPDNYEVMQRAHRDTGGNEHWQWEYRDNSRTIGWCPWPTSYGKVVKEVRHNRLHPHVGTRNTHTATGRS